MCRLIESIKIKGGRIFNLAYHQRRLNETRRQLFGCREELDLSRFIEVRDTDGFYKCRVLYKEKIEEVQIVSYKLPQIKSLKIVRADQIDYRYKFEDRSPLKGCFGQRGEADDILIIKEGQVADSYFCNVVFEKSGEFITPASCLLKGTKRQWLLDEGRITEREMRMEDIAKFDRVHLINALIDLEDNISLPVENILL